MESWLSVLLANAAGACLLAVVAALADWRLRSRPALVHGLWLLVLFHRLPPPVVRVPLTWPAPEVVTVDPEEPVEVVRPITVEEAHALLPANRRPAPRAEEPVQELPAAPAPVPEAPAWSWSWVEAAGWG